MEAGRGQKTSELRDAQKEESLITVVYEMSEVFYLVFVLMEPSGERVFHWSIKNMSQSLNVPV